jgi:hypothetical protein
MATSLIKIFICLLLPSLVWAGSVTVTVGQPTGAAAPTYLLEENLEAPGWENSWTESLRAGDTVDPDNAAAPAPIVGSYSLRITCADDSGTATSETIAVTASDNLYVYLIVNFDSLGNQASRGVAGILDASSNDLSIAFLADSASHNISLWDGTNSDSGTAPSADTTYHIWIEYEKGTGANSVSRIFVSANATKPGTADTEITGGSNTAQAAKIVLTAKKNMDVVFDKIRVSQTVIGSNPS